MKICDFIEIPHHTEIRWLSLSKVLKRFYNLFDEIVNFLNTRIKNKLNKFEELNDEQWLNDLSFSVDMLSYLND